MKPMKITKLLSPNDTGETGGHQAGILVPKQKEILEFFPNLRNSEKNPRAVVLLKDEDGKVWDCQFIYYNNKYFDENGTRNEYRLTRMTGYFYKNALRAGDTLIFNRDEYGQYSIRCEREKLNWENAINENEIETVHLTLSGNWKIINL